MASKRTSGADDSQPDKAGAPESVAKQLERVPPFDKVAEAGVLGSMLMDARAADVAIEELKTDDFYRQDHRIIFNVFCELFSASHGSNERIDELFLCSELERRGLLETVGGRDAIGRLIMDTPTAANVENYCAVVRDCAIRRELLDAAGRIVQSVNVPSAATGAEMLESAEKLVYDIADRRTSQDAVDINALLEVALGEAQKAQDARLAGLKLPVPAIPTGFVDLDNLLCGGLWPGELIVIAGRPSMGKTTFALNIARQISFRHEKEARPTAIFSLEMPKEQVAKNILCAAAQLDARKMRRFDFDENEFKDFKQGQAGLRKAPIYIDDSSALSVSQLRARCRRLKHRHDIAVVMVDYLQLMRGSPNAKSREQEVSEISRGLKAIARDLRIPVIVLSQLNRSAEKRENDEKRPQLSDLRESGAIEQDADVVIMLYRQEYYDMKDNAKHVNEGEALVMKNRNGPVGKVQVTFRKDILHFSSYAQNQNAAVGA